MYDFVGGPPSNILFISKASSHPDPGAWVRVFRQRFGKRFTVMCDEDFRALQDTFEPHRAWRDQFRFTRASHAMIVVVTPQEWTSYAQDVEIADASGRNIPVAYCRTVSFKSQGEEEAFLSYRTDGNDSWPRLCREHFDLCGPDAAAEIERLDEWVQKYAVPPPLLPELFEPEKPMAVSLRVRVRAGHGLEFVDWSGHEPLLVFNYGRRFTVHTARAEAWAKPKDTTQIVVEPVIGADPEELTAEVKLPHAGRGHAVLTVDDPQAMYVEDLPYPIYQTRKDLYMWWDFVVE